MSHAAGLPNAVKCQNVLLLGLLAIAVVCITFQEWFTGVLAVLLLIAHAHAQTKQRCILADDLRISNCRAEQLEIEQLALETGTEQLLLERNKAFLQARRAEQCRDDVESDLKDANERNRRLENVMSGLREACASKEDAHQETVHRLTLSEEERWRLQAALEEESGFLLVVADDMKARFAEIQDIKDILEVENDELARRLQNAEERAVTAEAVLDSIPGSREVRSSVCFEMLPWYMVPAGDDERSERS